MSDIWYRVRNPVTRIGDKRRDRAISTISRAYEAGYINKEELDQRTGIVMEAKYEHELEWAEDELPKNIEPRQEWRPTKDPSANAVPRPRAPHWDNFYLAVVAALIVMAATLPFLIAAL